MKHISNPLDDRAHREEFPSPTQDEIKRAFVAIAQAVAQIAADRYSKS